MTIFLDALETACYLSQRFFLTEGTVPVVGQRATSHRAF